MGDLSVDTAVEGGDGRYRARLSSDWEIWGPNGGYVASVALRAAGTHTTFRRPASLSGHYLSVAAFDEVDLEVATLRRSRRAESMRVSMSQRGNAIFEALVWAVDDDLQGLAHDFTRAPEVPGPDELKSVEELSPDRPRYAFWTNIEGKPVDWWERWEDRPPSPLVAQWCRFRPRATFDDPFLDAARYLLLIDTFVWPAAAGAYSASSVPLTYMAPSLDVDARFHHLAPESEWILCSAEAPIAHRGLIGGTSTIWSPEGKLLASGGSQLLCRPAPPPQQQP